MTNSQERRQGPKERRRGVILTREALEKLQEAKLKTEINENKGITYTLEALSDRTGLDPHTLIRVFTGETGVDRRTLSRCFKAFNLSLKPSDYCQPNRLLEADRETRKTKEQKTHIDWNTAPDVSIFYGQQAELATLKQWIIDDCMRLVVLSGMAGIGKTYLATKLTKQIQTNFQFVIWRSLRNTPSIEELLAELIQFLSRNSETDLPDTIEGRVLLLISYLQASRCLLVLDDFETILESCTLQPMLCNCFAGQYRQNFDGYGQLLRVVGETPHQSCLILTSREKPKGIKRLEGERLPIQILQLKGLPLEEAQKIFEDKGGFRGSQTDYSILIEYYKGNPLILKLVSTTIKNLFQGKIPEFLNQNTTIFGDICDLLDQQFERLSDVEKEIMSYLAMKKKPITVSDLRSQIEPQMSAKIMLEALESLEARSLLEQKADNFSLQPMLRDYVNMRYLISVSS